MIRKLVITKDLELHYDVAFNEIDNEEVLWYWIDFDHPTEVETNLLESHFHFHALAIEDCVNNINTPKFDYYEDYNFFILNSLYNGKAMPKEIALFVSDKYVVSYHNSSLVEIDEAFDRVKVNKKHWTRGTAYVAHQIMDKVVDHFFPAVYTIEEKLEKIEINEEEDTVYNLIDKLFKLRKELLKLRKTINSMRDLLYRIINSEKLEDFNEHKMYFSDIHDHLLKLSSMIESNREMTADIRDNYLSMNSAKLNRNTMVLTVVTTIFNPLTFIVGVYGMNFQFMPELNFKYGYFVALAIMAIIAVSMYLWFKRKGWMDL
ncbi:magnesium transporter [Clostridium acidisoli DSM 12555]|uniref:Magnesium transport protein CorA n=1 Tax=Clostridium acidisoli DSM 12555 TaxID=1121291 RepID=A0A1W1XZ00_9CLOT|nr:magnesium/cobalt transporter CorA [Clostridium acidisoli]SMC29122.1 magnesium transporter [Clostridium acidisoli DSM 12555]